MSPCIYAWTLPSAPLFLSGSSTRKLCLHPTPTLQLVNQTFRQSRILPIMSSQPLLTGDLDHVALSCHLPAIEVAKWYSNVLGFKSLNFDAYKSGKMPFPSVRLSAATILDFMTPPSSSAPEKTTSAMSGLSPNSHMCICILQPAFDALLARLDEHNIEYTNPPRNLYGAKGHGWAIYLKDVDGNSLEFRYYDS